jgi:mono/diheme cytochrome c family protein
MFMRLLATAALIAAPVVATAQDYGFGAADYANSCAQCHGTTGMGDGIIAGFPDSPPSDLNKLQADNGGVFPVASIYALIDGSAASGVHGSAEMPA